MRNDLDDRVRGAGGCRADSDRVGASGLVRSAAETRGLSASEPQLERQVRAFVWSRESGLAGGRLILAGGEEAPETAALAERLAAQYTCVEYRPCAGCRE